MDLGHVASVCERGTAPARLSVGEMSGVSSEGPRTCRGSGGRAAQTPSHPDPRPAAAGLGAGSPAQTHVLAQRAPCPSQRPLHPV